MPYYRECPHCHCNLDPGEVCDCPRKEEDVRTAVARPVRPMRPYERVKAQVYASGNRWAIENFHATHD